MDEKPKVALINRKATQRSVILLFAIAAGVAGYQYFRQVSIDLGEGSTANTKGWIAALETVAGGQRAVLISPEGEITPSPGYREGATDRDLVWRPSGNHLFFVSDRIDNVYHAYRWSIGRKEVERRTTGSLARSAIAFPPKGTDRADATALVVRGGMVFELDPVESTETRLVPPPEQQRATGNEEGTEDPTSGDLRIRSARWTPDRAWIVGVRRTDVGEALVIQSMTPDSQGTLPSMVTLAAGKKIEFDVNHTNGQIIFTAQGFQFPNAASIPPQFIKDGRVTRPWEHWIGIADPNDAKGGLPPVAVSPDKKLAFGAPAISPDGTTVAVLVGEYDESGLLVKELVVMPAQAEGGSARSVVLTGDISPPSWNPDSETLTFVQRDAQGKRSVYTIRKDGSGERNVTGGKGDFREPKFSPQ